MKRTKPPCGVIGLECLETRTLFNAPATLDNSFHYDGRAQFDVSGRFDHFNDVVVQQDGKVIAVGESRSVSPSPLVGQYSYLPVLAYYKADGNLDTTFGNGGKVILTGGDLGVESWNMTLHAVAKQNNGRIVVSGRMTFVGDNTYHAILMRFNGNGTLDTTFNGSGFWYSQDSGNLAMFRDVAIAGDGKIVAAGFGGHGGRMAAVARFNADGTPDASFDGDGRMVFNPGVMNSDVNGIALGGDGKIIVTGNANDSYYEYGEFDLLVARVRNDGTLDTSFSDDGWIRVDYNGGPDTGKEVAMLPNGQILVGGWAWSSHLTSLWRFNANGTLDNTFGQLGHAHGPAVGFTDMVVQNTGKIVVLEGGMNVRRFNADGTLEAGFYGTYGGAAAGKMAAVPGTDKIVAVGSAMVSGQSDAAVMRMHVGSVPNVPTNVKATALSQTAISVKWTDTSINEIQFEIQRSATKKFVNSWTKTVSAGFTSVTFNQLPPNTGWYFRVRAVNAIGKSAWSEIKFAQLRPTVFSTVRINSGGGAFTGADGKLFSADQHFVGGNSIAGTFPIGNTNDDALYSSYRTGLSFKYNIPVTNGNYIVKLHFAEPTASVIGQRKFNVLAEGYTMLNNVDIFAAAGLSNAYSAGFQAFVTDGSLTLDFVGQVGQALVSAIEVIPI